MTKFKVGEIVVINSKKELQINRNLEEGVVNGMIGIITSVGQSCYFVSFKREHYASLDELYTIDVIKIPFEENELEYLSEYIDNGMIAVVRNKRYLVMTRIYVVEITIITCLILKVGLIMIFLLTKCIIQLY